MLLNRKNSPKSVGDPIANRLSLSTMLPRAHVVSPIVTSVYIDRWTTLWRQSVPETNIFHSRSSVLVLAGTVNVTTGSYFDPVNVGESPSLLSSMTKRSGSLSQATTRSDVS